MSEEEVIQFISACWNKFGEHTATLVSAEQADIEIFLSLLKYDLDELRGNNKTLQATTAEQGAEIAGLRDALGQVYNEAEDRAVVYEATIAEMGNVIGNDQAQIKFYRDAVADKEDEVARLLALAEAAKEMAKGGIYADPENSICAFCGVDINYKSHAPTCPVLVVEGESNA